MTASRAPNAKTLKFGTLWFLPPGLILVLLCLVWRATILVTARRRQALQERSQFLRKRCL
jgi:threonine/homoserine/homoserine lactone efflux protein